MRKLTVNDLNTVCGGNDEDTDNTENTNNDNGQRISQLFNLATQMLKLDHDTKMAAIRNIR